ncbi:MAG TPA: type B DNA-directed DNA polymerase [Methanoregulaceae archaeon]|nr:type B DNA-directed DNA polymerase [Methanoregulaceae archaeon]
MWIIDSRYRDGVELWEKKKRVRRVTIPCSPSFYLHLRDPHAHWELVEALESRYEVEECDFRTIHGVLEGYRIGAGREVAEAIEKQTRFEACLYNVDLRLDHRYMAEQGIFPCGEQGESRFEPDFLMPLEVMEIAVRDNPMIRGPITRVDVVHERAEHLSGSDQSIISDLAALVESCDPDVILFPLSDVWMPRILSQARRYGIDLRISRTGQFRRMAERSYQSYGRTEYRVGSLIPDGRILIDTRQSFNFRESDLSGIILGSRLTGLAPNLAARFTSGTLISAYEVYEALRQDIAVPFRKSDPEDVRRFGDLKAADRGGMMFQPVPGLYEEVYEIDFTSLYPSVIVRYNLSPETLHDPARKGFLPGVLEPLLMLRRETKRRKADDPRYAGLDSLLKWMLVTCFGYTGYKNAKFGRIEVHEQITCHARDILLLTRDIAEELDFEVLHGIVDSLWVRGGDAPLLKQRVERETALHTTLDAYDWIVFLPMPDGFGAYNRYFGRLADGTMKVRGIAARRRDVPGYVKSMQHGILDLMKGARTRRELAEVEYKAYQRYLRAAELLPSADPAEMAIRRQVSRLTYSRNCPEASAVRACKEAGIELAPGMEIGYVVTDSRTWAVELDWNATRFDQTYYRRLLDKAWEEIRFAFEEARGKKGEEGE